MDDAGNGGDRAVTAALDATQASVHLRLRGPIGEDDLTGLRQQLAACLCSGVADIRVHVDEQEELDLQVLLALHGVAGYLHRRGGSLAVVGAGPRVLKAMTINELEHLLPPAADRCAPTGSPPVRGLAAR